MLDYDCYSESSLHLSGRHYLVDSDHSRLQFCLLLLKQAANMVNLCSWRQKPEGGVDIQIRPKYFKVKSDHCYCL